MKSVEDHFWWSLLWILCPSSIWVPLSSSMLRDLSFIMSLNISFNQASFSVSSGTPIILMFCLLHGIFFFFPLLAGSYWKLGKLPAVWWPPGPILNGTHGTSSWFYFPVGAVQCDESELSSPLAYCMHSLLLSSRDFTAECKMSPIVALVGVWAMKSTLFPHVCERAPLLCLYLIGFLKSVQPVII